MKKLIVKYKHFILYAVFGVLTTVVNIAAYWLCTRVLGLPTVPSTVIAWFLAVFFAYITNRRLVFESEAQGKREILTECAKFFAMRIATGIFDIAFMYVTVDVLKWNDVAMKFVSNVIVIVLNYLASRLVVFRKKS